MNKALRKSVRKALPLLPSVTDLVNAAGKGEIKRGWYARANAVIREKYGRDADIFIALLAATSPRQSVRLNLLMAQHIFSAWEFLGRPTDRDSLFEIAKISDLPGREGNVIRALKGEALSGPKVTAFQANLLNDLEKVTIDTWMIAFAGIAHERLLMTKGAILAYKRRVSKAARRLGWRPAEVQECVWSYCYSYTRKISVGEVPEFRFEIEKSDDAI